MVAPAPLTRWTWAGAVLVAGGLILALALHGRRPNPEMAIFEPAGVMLGIAPERVHAVEVRAGSRRLRFARAAGGAWTVAGPGAPGDWRSRLETGLRLLHDSTPQRVLSGPEVGDTPVAEFGLASPRCAVTVLADGANVFSIEFGSLNAQGLAQYARIAGRDGLVLLSRFVGEPWEALAGAR